MIDPHREHASQNAGARPNSPKTAQRLPCMTSPPQHLVQTIFDTIGTFIKDLRAGGPAQGTTPAAPSSASSASAPTQPSAVTAATTTAAAAVSSVQTTSKPASKAAKPAIVSPVLNLSEKFFARPADLYACFVEEGRVNAFTQSKSSIEAKVGGSFNWLNGSVVGEFVEMQPHSKLVMKWRFNTWEEGCFSVVSGLLKRFGDRAG